MDMINPFNSYWEEVHGFPFPVVDLEVNDWYEDESDSRDNVESEESDSHDN